MPELIGWLRNQLGIPTTAAGGPESGSARAKRCSSSAPDRSAW